jgi:hypothetical protein
MRHTSLVFTYPVPQHSGGADFREDSNKVEADTERSSCSSNIKAHISRVRVSDQVAEKGKITVDICNIRLGYGSLILTKRAEATRSLHMPHYPTT